MRLLYVLGTWVVFALVFPVLALMRKTREGTWQRLGWLPRGLIPQGPGPRIWLHGASAGDLLALAPMIDQLRRRFPKAKVMVSTMTNTGHLMARERLSGRTDAIFYSPWDVWGATRRAVRALRPDVLVLEYTEIWPNLIRAASASGCKVVLTNGRFSEKNMPRYRALFSLFGNPLKDLSLLLMREPEEAERALLLGAPRERVQVTGNTKFDALAPLESAPVDEALREALGLLPEERVWILGSTHEGEEELLLQVYRRLLEVAPDLRLVIAPRYLERVSRVLEQVAAAGLKAALRTEGNALRQRVVILDSIGELARAYRLATLVFVGGSFTSRGGQNILEPAAQGRPVLFGPHMENFRDSVQVLVGRGGIQVQDAEHLSFVMKELLSRPESLTALGQLAQTAVRQVSGASARNVAAIAELLK